MVANIEEQWRNQPVDIVDLAPVDTTPFTPLHPRSLRQQRMIWSVGIGAVAASLIVVTLVVGLGVVAVAAVVGLAASLMALAWVIEGLAFRHRGVQLRERDVSTRHGVIARTTTSVPFTRVQHVTVTQGPLDRLFDLADVVIYTAGAGLADARVKGLDPAQADRLRQDILNRSARLANPGGSADGSVGSAEGSGGSADGSVGSAGGSADG